ncbi:hypothetical protein B0H19DRAFT_209338 [Mycena capillaripes]|nr:hypothetical protein B0H19DRAFT_209338 [Mycena capillaripes]
MMRRYPPSQLTVAVLNLPFLSLFSFCIHLHPIPWKADKIQILTTLVHPLSILLFLFHSHTIHQLGAGGRPWALARLSLPHESLTVISHLFSVPRSWPLRHPLPFRTMYSIPFRILFSVISPFFLRVILQVPNQVIAVSELTTTQRASRGLKKNPLSGPHPTRPGRVEQASLAWGAIVKPQASLKK